jgi:NhaP-type Na+/H+ or K+/H+ antiporter
MMLSEPVIALLLIGAVLSLWAGRVGVPYPALLGLAGAVLALVPGVPEARLDPELALALFVAPTLLDAAYDASPPLAVCLAVVLIRIAWVMSYNTVNRWKIRRFGVRLRRPMSLPTVGSGLVISWCGMRGIVTLALPNGESGATFPYRDLIVLCAFSVVLFTLLVQGITLRPLVLRLGLRDDGLVAREIALARAETAREALRVLNETRHVQPPCSGKSTNRVFDRAPVKTQQQRATRPI